MLSLIISLGFLLLLSIASNNGAVNAFQTPLSSSLRSAAKINNIKLFSTTEKTTTTTKTDNNNNDQWIKNELNGKSQQDDDISDQEEEERKNRSVIGPDEVLIYDTSLRDGTQGESVSASCDDKIKITKRLASFGMDYIEAGWPGSNPKDAEFFERAQTELTKKEFAKLSAFGSTRRKGISVEDDPQIQALLDSNAPTICIVAKSHLWQVTDIIRAKPEENIQMIYDSVSYLVKKGRKKVYIDLEHYFDGYKYNKDYVMECCSAAVNGGASGLVLCDTNGGSMPWDVQEATQFVVNEFVLKSNNKNKENKGKGGITIGIHCHNDCGMAVANSIMAIKAGAGMIQGTINGIGERTGNADLCSIIPSLSLHVKTTKMTCNSQLSQITSLSRFVDETLNRSPTINAPYVGISAFAHKGGLHVAALERSPDSYQHVSPELVGNKKRILISELSGRQNILGKMKQVGKEYTGGGTGETADDEQEEAKKVSDRATAILHRVKKLESKGYTFEGAEASVDLMILHSTEGYCPPFHVLDYSAQVYDSNLDSAHRVLDIEKAQQQDKEKESDADGNHNCNKCIGPTARATIKVRVPNFDDEEIVDEYDVTTTTTTTTTADDDDQMYVDRLEVSDGEGPVDALYKALKRALVPTHDILKHVELIDYKVRILDPESATKAATRVMIEFYMPPQAAPAHHDDDGSNDDNNGTNGKKPKKWTTVSVDRNVISASLNALVDGFEYALVEHSRGCLIE